jgi:hypothetical protein
MSVIVGDGLIPEAACVYDVRDAIARPNVVLLAHIAGTLGQAIPVGSTIYNLEPLFDGCRSLTLGYLDVLRTFNVWDYQRRNVEFLAGHGIAATHVPWGYVGALERAVPATKDIECLFVGSITPRRAQVLAEVGARCRLVTAQGVYGTELDRLVARARIVVNVHSCDAEHPLEVVRLNYLMANGCAIVSEPGWDELDNAAYQGGLVLSRRPADDCEELLSKPERIMALGEAARSTIRRMPMKVPS